MRAGWSTLLLLHRDICQPDVTTGIITVLTVPVLGPVDKLRAPAWTESFHPLRDHQRLWKKVA